MGTSNSSVGSSYALERLSKAIETLKNHPNSDVRRRAQKKIDQWNTFFDNLASGQLSVGSRTPLANTPAWVTLEVAHGGFATGRYLAESPIGEDELALLDNISNGIKGQTEREKLNYYFLTDKGLSKLSSAIETGCYRIDVPEHGALLVVAWLFTNGLEEQALDLVNELSPLMHRLRFYPYFEKSYKPQGAVVRLHSVKDVVKPLQNKSENERIKAMNNTLNVWNPLYDDLVSLWLETVDGDVPYLDDNRTIKGGMPCRNFSEDWFKRRIEWLGRYTKACKKYGQTGRHHHWKSNFQRLASVLEKYTSDRKILSKQDVGSVRLALANTVTKHGVPGSESRQACRDIQKLVGSKPTHAQLAKVLARRLLKFPESGGIPSLDVISGVITKEEASWAMAGYSIPQSLLDKVAIALEAPVQELIDRGVIGSAEVLASVLPQITAQVTAAGIEDTKLRTLFGHIYAAFRRRRSLLLLNLSHQVTIDELPWISVLNSMRRSSLKTESKAQQTLAEVTNLTISAFPQTILPNPLVRELSVLSRASGLNLPLVEEVAADIFMGTFTAKWLNAAQVTSRLLEKSLYAKYYDLPSPEVFESEHELGGLLSRMKKQWGRNTADGFAQMCQTRASEAGDSSGSWVAKNGAVLEQSQILTTHNLAVLVDSLGLQQAVQSMASALVDDIFAWIFKRHSQPVRHYRAQLQLVKNSAYAWRQAIFLLSFATEEIRAEKLSNLERLSKEHQSRKHEFRSTTPLDLVVGGLIGIHQGQRFDSRGFMNNGRRFLGWSVGSHWMLSS